MTMPIMSKTEMVVMKPRVRARTMLHPDLRLEPTQMVMMARVAAVVAGAVVVIAAANVSARADEPWSGEPVEVSGVLDLRDEGYGFIRVNGYLPTRDDVYVSVKQTRQFSLRRGDVIVGTSRPAARNEKEPGAASHRLC